MFCLWRPRPKDTNRIWLAFNAQSTMYNTNRLDSSFSQGTFGFCVFLREIEAKRARLSKTETEHCVQADEGVTLSAASMGTLHCLSIIKKIMEKKERETFYPAFSRQFSSLQTDLNKMDRKHTHTKEAKSRSSDHICHISQTQRRIIFIMVSWAFFPLWPKERGWEWWEIIVEKWLGNNLIAGKLSVRKSQTCWGLFFFFADFYK